MEHLDTSLRHRIWIWVILCGARDWTLWSLWVPSNLEYDSVLCSGSKELGEKFKLKTDIFAFHREGKSAQNCRVKHLYFWLSLCIPLTLGTWALILFSVPLFHSVFHLDLLPLSMLYFYKTCLQKGQKSFNLSSYYKLAHQEEIYYSSSFPCALLEGLFGASLPKLLCVYRYFLK